MFVGLKSGAFQASSLIRHATELCKVYLEVKAILFSCYILMTIIATTLLFIDLLVSPPESRFSLCYRNWTNPAERIMSLLNLALQGAGIARCETSFEEQLKA